MPCHLHPAPKFDGGSSLGQEGWTKGVRRPPVSQALPGSGDRTQRNARFPVELAWQWKTSHNFMSIHVYTIYILNN
jgi:hypothetical protein